MDVLLILLIVILLFFLILFILSLSIYLIYLWKGRKLDKELEQINSVNFPLYKDFKIINPYDNKGTYYKAQLHTHTTKSDGRLTPTKLVKKYKEAGYAFLAITDHDKVTECNGFNDKSFVTITGEEKTIPEPFWPLGQHLLRLFVTDKGRKYDLQAILDETSLENGLVGICHPSTASGLGTQRWELDRLKKLNNILLIEIVNHFSEEEKNIVYWHELLKYYGPQKPIWGIASDDAHNVEDIDKDWIMVKVNQITEKELYRALSEGSFYSTQGPLMVFKVISNKIKVSSDQILHVKFIDANHKTLKSREGKEFIYEANGDEGFIRVEGINDKGQKVWSQPFWIVEK